MGKVGGNLRTTLGEHLLDGEGILSVRIFFLGLQFSILQKLLSYSSVEGFLKVSNPSGGEQDLV